MFRLLAILIFGVSLLAAAGCQSRGDFAQGSPTAAPTAVAPDDCRVETVQRPHTNFKGYLRLRPEKVLVCPDETVRPAENQHTGG